MLKSPISAIAVVTARNVVHAALYLVVVLLGMLGTTLALILPALTLALLSEDEARVRPIELKRLVGDNARLRALGWSPRIPIETMLDDVLEYWRTQTT